jgi:hypothetical protein
MVIAARQFARTFPNHRCAAYDHPQVTVTGCVGTTQSTFPESRVMCGLVPEERIELSRAYTYGILSPEKINIIRRNLQQPTTTQHNQSAAPVKG